MFSCVILPRDVSSPPEHITNSIGRVVLRKSGRTTSSEGFLLRFHYRRPVILIGLATDILAEGFNITAGRIEVTVPSVETGDDYQLVRECLSFTRPVAHAYFSRTNVSVILRSVR